MGEINPSKKYKLYQELKDLLLKLRAKSQNYEIVEAWDSMILIVESVKEFWMNNKPPEDNNGTNDKRST